MALVSEGAKLAAIHRSGAFFARIKIDGKVIRRSLKTNIWTTAKLRLLDFQKKHHETRGSVVVPCPVTFEVAGQTLAHDDRPALWLHSSNGGIDAVCSFIQHLLQKFDPDGRVTFEWSHDYSKPRTDAYGGGAAIITAREIKTMSTGEWLALNAA